MTATRRFTGALTLLALLCGCGSLSFGGATPAPPAMREADTASRLRVAAAAEASGQHHIALSLYNAAAAAEPRRADIQARFAAALVRQGDETRAGEVLRQALVQHRDDPRLLVQLGRLRLRAGSAEQALIQFDQAVSRSPGDAAALDGRGVALDMLGRHEEAQHSYRQALAAQPSRVATANNLGVSLLLSGRAGDAIQVLRPVALRPEAPERVRVNLALAEALAGNQHPAETLTAQDGRQMGLAQIMSMLREGAAGS